MTSYETDDAGPRRAEFLDVLGHIDGTLLVIEQVLDSLSRAAEKFCRPVFGGLAPERERGVRYLLDQLRVERERLAAQLPWIDDEDEDDGDLMLVLGAIEALLGCLNPLLPEHSLRHLGIELAGRVDDIDPYFRRTPLRRLELFE